MAAVVDAPPSRRIKELEVMVADVVVETPDTSTLVFFTGNDHQEYRAGHFLTIDPHQFEARTVHGVPRGPEREEGAAARLLHVLGSTGAPPRRDREGRAVRAGSGSVPNFSMVKYALEFHPRLRHTLLYSNKTWRDVIFRDALTDLERKHPERLRVIHTLTREPDVALCGPFVRKGRVSAALIRELIPDLDSSIIYVCGPASRNGIAMSRKPKARSRRPVFSNRSWRI